MRWYFLITVSFFLYIFKVMNQKNRKVGIKLWLNYLMLFNIIQM